MTYYVGIDPGRNGGVAIIANGGRCVDLFKMPRSVEELADEFRYRVEKPKTILLEEAASRTGQGVRSVFTYGRGFGSIEGVLIALRLKYSLVSPQDWQRTMHAGICKKKFRDPKERSLIAAKKYYPQETFIPQGCSVPHDGIIDALLIARYARWIDTCGISTILDFKSK